MNAWGPFGNKLITKLSNDLVFCKNQSCGPVLPAYPGKYCKNRKGESWMSKKREAIILRRGNNNTHFFLRKKVTSGVGHLCVTEMHKIMHCG